MSSKRKVSKQDDNSFTLLLLNILVIIISLIAFLHQQTGFLGQFLYCLTKTIFGLLWPLFFIALILYCLYRLFKKSIKIKNINRYILAVCLLFVSAGLIVAIVIYGKDIVYSEIIKEFFNNFSSIFNQTITNNVGLVFTILYALIYLLSGYIGNIIVVVVFIVASLILLLSDFIKDLKTKEKVEIKQPNKTINEVSSFLNFNKKENKEKKEKKKKEKPTKVKEDSEDSSKKQVEQNDDVELKVDPINNSKVEYTLPSLTLLDNYKIVKKNVNEQYVNEKWKLLEEVLNNFSLESKLVGCNIGPSVTQFELEPLNNFDIKKYFKVQDNIKMALAVTDVRIQAPIPGKKAIGIEIPNQQRTVVKLKELLDHVDPKYKNNPLTIALGKDLTGNYVYAPIDKMPHLLIAGATGSGKSVCINSIILTIIMRALPTEVQLILIDPKKVEFAPYQKIPHLACPVVNDTSKAAVTLKKLVDIMDERYSKFSENTARNIDEYNQKCPDKKMSRIVCIIDEMADLMFSHRNEVETYIQRLSAMARASGIYLILATQRPSTDVITGVIKANIRSRIAFAVTSPYDSRTIIDKIGAENLLGNGDMLFAPSYESTLTRIQGVYVSDEEIERVVKYLEASTKDTDNFFIEKFLVDENTDEDDNNNNTSYDDPAYENVKKYVMSQKTISVSALQRKFSFGFPRAAKLIDCLQQDGIISESNGSKPREVLIRNEDAD